MAIELKFLKSDPDVQWGFRLVGGTDFEQPVVVVKVNKDSLAEAAGLQVGDIIVRVNDTSTARLSHNEVHDLLQAGGLEFDLGIRRGRFSTSISNEDEDTEISDILKEVCKETDVLNGDLKKRDHINVDSDISELSDVSENLAGQEQVIYASALEKYSETMKEKKWSTFLVKPDKPIPKPKRTVEQPAVQGEPYRVVIKKQPKRPFQIKKVQFDENVNEVEVDIETKEIEEESSHIQMMGHTEVENVEVEVKVTETEEIIIEECEQDETEVTKISEKYEEEEEVSEEEHLHIQSDSIETKLPWANIKIDTSIESSSNLQDQLLTVQKQLQALSQLPSKIQTTLDAISKQLAIIVDTKDNLVNGEEREEGSSSTKDENEPSTEEEILEETEETSEKAEAEEIRDQELDEDNSSIEEEMEEDIVREEEREEEKQEQVDEEKEPDPYQGLTEEEKQEAIKREQLEAKKRKAMEERTPRPIQRPIILPGGRKWSNPEDAVPCFRKPKMSDEKVIETIESNLEVIVGNRKGINFLKYQPPPKNLDYLQRSEVYRLVHDMEPPVRGITTRPEKIPSVQDYYEATRGSPCSSSN